MRVLIIAGLLMAAGCPAKKSADSGPAADKSPAEKPPTPPKTEHGAEVALGTATLAGYSFEAVALGAIRAGSDAAVALKVTATPDGKDWKTLALYVWAEAADGAKLSAPDKVRVEDGRLHAHVSVRKDAQAAAARIVIRLRDGELDQRTQVAVPQAATEGPKAKHPHVKTPHDGVLAELVDGDKAIGWVELKLHDDKGDLELWLGRDKALATPIDLPLDAEVTVTFVDKDGKRVALAPRDSEKNPDEDGKANLREGKTNYFIFPGATGQDAAWLMGKDFSAQVTVTLKAGESAYQTAPFILKPHTHGPGGGH